MKTQPSIRRLALAALALAVLPAATGSAAPAIYVTNYNGGTNGNVPAYSSTGTIATGYTAPAGFSDPEGVAVNPSTNTLYVMDTAKSTIRTFNATTGAETQIGFANATGLSGPRGLLLAGGNLLAANVKGNTVTAYNPANGTAGTGFTSPTGLKGPQGFGILGNTVFVSNFGTSVTTGFVSAFNLSTGAAVAGFTTITGLSDPFGLAVSGNDLFEANFKNGTGTTVGEYNATTGAVINANFLTGLMVRQVWRSWATTCWSPSAMVRRWPSTAFRPAATRRVRWSTPTSSRA